MHARLGRRSGPVLRLIDVHILVHVGGSVVGVAVARSTCSGLDAGGRTRRQQEELSQREGQQVLTLTGSQLFGKPHDTLTSPTDRDAAFSYKTQKRPLADAVALGKPG
jgi:hypothetical protein